MPLPSTGSRPRLSRRTLLQAGSLGFFGLTLPEVLRARAATQPSQQTRRPVRGVILAHLTGGLSHIDSLDPKPQAPKEIRGTFLSIPTAVPGVRLCEFLPRLARRLNEVTVIRSMRTMTLVHEPAAHRMLCGVDQTPVGTGNTALRRDRPHLGSLLARARPLTGVPPTVVLPHRLRSQGSYPGQNAGFLGARFDPWFVTGDPNGPSFGPGDLALPPEISVDRLRNRSSLLGALDRGESGVMDAHRQQAIDILTANRCRDAFHLNREEPRMRDTYGRNLMGQGLLLGRRLIEAGVPLVQVNMGHSEAWDTHGDNFGAMQNRLLPPFDKALTALLDDLTDRGLRDEVLVVVTSEFGRAPRVGQPVPGGCGASMDGRDHWANVFSLLAFGSGVGRGQVLGASDRIGAYPASVAWTPADLGANILQALGVNPTLTLRDETGQSFPVNSGTPIAWG